VPLTGRKDQGTNRGRLSSSRDKTFSGWMDKDKRNLSSQRRSKRPVLVLGRGRERKGKKEETKKNRRNKKPSPN